MTVPPIPDEADAATPPARSMPAGRASATLLPPARLTGPIPWVIAILIALVVIAAAGGLALRNLAGNARGELSSGLTVQVIEANPDLSAARSRDAARLLSGLDGVVSVRQVPEAELERLLEPWLGPAAASGDVPIPALIDVELDARVQSADVARIAAALQSEVPGARVDAQSQWLQPVYRALGALQWLALALIGLVALATSAAVWLAARNAFASASETVEIIHLLGATDRQISAVFLKTVLREAAFGAAVGTLLGAGAVWLLGQQFAALDSGMTQSAGLSIADWLVIAAIPLAGVLLALVTARITIALALRAML